MDAARGARSAPPPCSPSGAVERGRVVSSPPARISLVHAVLVAVQAAFASLSVAGKIVLEHVPPHALLLARTAGAAAVFVALARGRIGLGARDTLRAALLGVLGVFLNQVLFLHGLERTTAVRATVLVTTIPVFTALVAVAARRERASGAVAAGIGCALLGILVLVGPAALTDARGAVVGDALVALNSLSYAVYLVFVRDLVERHGGLRVVAVAFCAGTLLALPVGTAPLVRALGSAPPDALGWLAYVVAIPTVFTYVANAWALRRVPSSTVASFVFLQPLIAALLAVPLLGERVGLDLLVSGTLVLAGVALVTRGGRRATMRP
ncbi:MAG: DMT family transporter [Myxococcales bacterium]|nr:DMT family transporter [Myxococcales bacterium]